MDTQSHCLPQKLWLRFLTLSTVSPDVSFLALAVVLSTGPAIHAPHTALLDCEEEKKNTDASHQIIFTGLSINYRSNLTANIFRVFY